MAKKEERFYLYMYRPFKIMVGVLYNDFIPKQGSCDWYYLTRFQTLVYLITGKLPHERKPNGKDKERKPNGKDK